MRTSSLRLLVASRRSRCAESSSNRIEDVADNEPTPPRAAGALLVRVRAPEVATAIGARFETHGHCGPAADCHERRSTPLVLTIGWALKSAGLAALRKCRRSILGMRADGAFPVPGNSGGARSPSGDAARPL